MLVIQIMYDKILMNLNFSLFVLQYTECELTFTKMLN